VATGSFLPDRNLIPCPGPDTHPPILHITMTETQTQRLLEAAAALSYLLRYSGVPHAFYGGILTSVLANSPHSAEIFCIVESSHPHPFRRVRDAISDSQDFTPTHSPWTNRLHVTYHKLIPSIAIEILPAGEAGPRHLDTTTVAKIHGVPFLTVSEFLRAKLKSWIMCGSFFIVGC